MIKKANELNYTAELRLRAEELARDLSRDTEKDLHELRLHQIELELQNEALHRAQAELDSERARYFDLYDLAPVGYVTVSEQGLIQETNLTAAVMLDVSRAELLKQPVPRFIRKEDADRYYLQSKKLIRNGTPQTCELGMVRNDGKGFFAQLAMTAGKNTNGEPICRIAISDITERKLAEDALEESREKHRGLSEAPFEAIFISEKGICIEQNQAAERMFGYSDSEAIGRPGTEWISPEDRETVLNHMLSGNDQTYEVTALRKDGSTFPVFIRGKVMHYKDRTVRVTSLSDISSRKQAEEALQESENMLRRAQEIAHIGHFKFNPVSGVVEGSDELFRIFGLTRKQFQFADFVNSVHPDDRASDLAFIESYIALKTNYEHEHRLLLPDGTLKWICLIGTFSTALFKGPKLIVGTVQDITERKRAELQREVLYQVQRAVSSQLDTDLVVRFAVETIAWLTGYPHVCIALPDANGAHWIVRAAAGSLAAELGAIYPIHQGVIGRVFKTGQAQRVRDILDDPDYVRDVIVENAPLLRSELVVPFFRGGYLLGALNVESDRVDEFGEADAKMFQTVADMIALALENARLYGEAQQEIGVRQQTEEALRESHHLLEGIFASLRDAVFIIDGQTTVITDCNPAATEIFGYSREEMVGRPTEFLHIDQAALEAFRKHLFPAVAEKGFLFLPEFEMKRMDGTVFPTEHNVMPLEDEQGKRIGWVSVVRDITERKKAETAMRESEGRLKEAQRIALMGNWELDLENNNLVWSDEIYRIFEIDPAKFGASYVAFLDAIHPDDREMVDQAYTSSLETKTPYEIDHRLLMPDGRVKYVREHCESFYAADGHALRSVGIVQDITGRTQTEDALRQSEASFGQILHSLDGMVYVADMSTYEVLFINEFGKKIVGDATGKICWQILQSGQKGPCSFCTNDRLLHPDGSPTGVYVWEFQNTFTRAWYECRDMAIIWPDKRTVRMEVAVDITARKQAEEDRIAREIAEQANRAKSEFISRMSHELRTPLNAILGFSQLLKMDELKPNQIRGVEQIHKSGRHLLNLVNEMLDMARIESGKMRISPEPVRLADTLLEAFEFIRPLAEARHISVTLETTASSDVFVQADPQSLRQVLLNLFSNAVKYNRESGEIAITANLTIDGYLRLEVRDTGEGIPPEKMERLFTPFDRLDRESIEQEGTGLGLALSKGLVEAMGGRIGAQSMPGVGSIFWLELKLVTEKPTEVILAEVDEHLSEALRVRTRDGVVLYVEDNLDNLKLVEAIMERLPWVKLMTAMQGRLALDLAQEHQPDLILLDLHLPDMHGSEVLRCLKAEPATQKTPVIILSADAMPEHIANLLAGGARAYLTKPIDIQEFLKAVEECLGDASRVQ